MRNIHIEFSSGPNSGQIVQLANRTLVFGRTMGSDVVLDWDGLISSQHFKIQKEENRYVLHDLGSTNGTFVNGNPVRSHELATGDQITLGKTVLLVKGDEDAIFPAKSKSYANPFESSIWPAYRSEGMVASGSDRPEHEAAIATKISDCKQDIQSSQLTKPADSVGKSMEISDSMPSGFTQVRLRVISQQEKGKLFWLSLGQSSTFGRTEKSDCPIPLDSSLSSEHFRVTCAADQCLLEDLQSRSGVWLNGKKISKAPVHHGDRLLAGATEFSIEIQGVAGAIRATEPGNARASNVAGVKPRAPTKRVYDVSRSQCASGILRLRGKLLEGDGQDEASIVEFFETIHAHAPLQVLIDFSRISLPFPEGMVAEEHSLFDWLPSGSIEKSPMLFVLDELVPWKSFVDEAWGCDAVIGLRSELPKVELLAKFQDLLVGSANGPEASRGILGFCWPSVLESLMENNSNGFTETFFADVSLVLIEKQGKPEYWQLFGKEAEVDKTMKIGMRIVKDKAEEHVASKSV